MALQRRVKWFFTLLVLANIVIMAIAFLGGFGGKSKPSKPIPNPNGFDDFLKAGNMIRGNISHYDELNSAELAALVATNSEALKLARTGLSRECEMQDVYALTNDPTKVLGLLSDLGWTLVAEIKLAQLDGRTNDIVKSCLDLARYGQKGMAGGTILFAISIGGFQSLAMRHLTPLMEKLDAGNSRAIARTFETIDVEENSPEEILQREEEYRKKNSNIIDRATAALNRKEIQAATDRQMNRYRADQLKRRNLMVVFAARAYELEKGKPPQKVEDLVPDYLKAIPKDPFSGTNMVYGRPITAP